MKLLTHNFLSSRFLQGANEGYPLKLHVTKVEEQNRTVEDDMFSNYLKRIDYEALKVGAQAVGFTDLPDKLPETAHFSKYPEKLKKTLAHVLFNIEIIEGELECPDTGRRFPIKDGIPNMLANEDECKS